MARLIDADALKKDWSMRDKCEDCPQDTRRCQYDVDFSRMDICQMIDDAPTIGGWISVKDRLPDDQNTVLAVKQLKGGGRSICLAYCIREHPTFHPETRTYTKEIYWVCGGNNNITHWMPLPELPEVSE